MDLKRRRVICLRKPISFVKAPSTEIEDQPRKTGLANGAEKMSELNEEDLKRKSQFEIPFGKSDSSPETNIAGGSAAYKQIFIKFSTKFDQNLMDWSLVYDQPLHKLT